jgi:hypothetical protein
MSVQGVGLELSFFLKALANRASSKHVKYY